MYCSKCGAENPEESVFCNKCGSNLLGKQAELKLNFITKMSGLLGKFNFLNNKKVIAIGCMVIICLVAGIIYFNNPMVKFKNSLAKNDYYQAGSIYKAKIKGDAGKEADVNSYLQKEIDNIVQDFKNDKLTYEEAKSKLDTIRNTGLMALEVTKATNEITKLNDSEIAFSKGEECLKNSDYVGALKEFKKVIPEDKNYNKAKEQISSNEEKYKQQVLQLADESANAKDYSRAVSLLKDAMKVVSNNQDISTKLANYQKLFETDQLVIIESAKIAVQDTRWKTLYPDMMQAILTNNSQKTIKKMQVGFLGFDSNGYPLKIKSQFDYSGGNYEYVGHAEDVNIIAGGRFGDGVGWKLDESHGISKVLACVKSATFYDGTTWDNPYYPYWLEQYKEKPLS